MVFYFLNQLKSNENEAVQKYNYYCRKCFENSKNTCCKWLCHGSKFTSGLFCCFSAFTCMN